MKLPDLNVVITDVSLHDELAAETRRANEARRRAQRVAQARASRAYNAHARGPAPAREQKVVSP